MAGKTIKNKVVVNAHDNATPTLNKVKKEFRIFSRQVKSFGNELKGLGAITSLPIAGAFTSAAAIIKNSVSSMVSYGGAVDDSSRNLSIASDALQSFRYAAEQSGSSASQMDGAIAMLNKNMANVASGGNKNLAGLMKHLGISMTDSNGNMKDAAQLMPEIADAIRSQTTATQKAYIATQFFGKSGQDLIKTLSEGAAGLEAQRKEAEKFGVIMGEEDVAAATLFGDSLTRTRYATQGLQNAIGGKLLPILQPLLDDFNDWIAVNREWIATEIAGAIEDFAESFKNIDIKAVVTGFVSFIKTSASVFSALGGLKTVGIAVASLFGGKVIASVFGVGKALVSLIPTIISLSAALWANPIVLIVGAVVAAVGALVFGAIQLYKHWDEVLEWFKDVWGGVKEKICEFFDWYCSLWGSSAEETIADFSVALDFIQSIPDKIKQAFNGVIEFFSSLWEGVKDAFFKPFDGAMSSFETVKSGISGLWDKATGFFSSDDEPGMQVPERTENVLNQTQATPQTLPGNMVLQGENRSEVIVKIKTDENAKAEVEQERTTGSSLNTSILADTGVTR